MANDSRALSRADSSESDPSPSTPLLKSGRQDPGDRPRSESQQSSHNTEDEWDSKHNQYNPKNWPSWYKWLTVVLVSFVELLTLMPNYMYAPNIPDAQKDLGTTNTTLVTFSLTIYLLGFGFGPLLFAPLSEMYGRAIIYKSCISMFLLTTTACALSANVGMLIAFRLLAGSFGAAPVAIGGAVIGDLFPVRTRGTAMSIYQSGQIISAVIGPPIGGLIGAYTSWRWVFWVVVIMSIIALICTFLILKETHAPTLKGSLHLTSSSEPKQRLTAQLTTAVTRPLTLLIKSRVVLLSSILIFLVIGIVNLFLTVMSRTFQQLYHIGSGQSGLIYLGLALGFVTASTVFGLTNDRIMHTLANRYHTDHKPEYRLPAAIAAMPFVVAGLLWYGWALQARAQWVIPIAGSGVTVIGVSTIQLSITTYIVDSFDDFSASALAAITMARSIGGALLPLVGLLLDEKLGQGWGNSVLALLALLCSVIPIVLYIYGAKWRAGFTTEHL